jgi:type II secretory pathway pseudopilin PulG
MLLETRNKCLQEEGYSMVSLFVVLSVLSVMLGFLLPVWGTVVKREREAELIFRGEQYARAIGLYQRKYANAYPRSIDALLNERFLRKKYMDPMTSDGQFKLIFEGELTQSDSNNEPLQIGFTSRNLSLGFDEESIGIVGVVSRSNKESLRVYKDKSNYNEWLFVWKNSEAAGGF